MNLITHIEHPRQAAHPRLAIAAWDDFEPTARSRRARTATSSVRTRARLRHAHVSWGETPDLYLREEMS
jgi:hypothetical protein